MSFNTNNFMQPDGSDLPVWMMDPGFSAQQQLQRKQQKQQDQLRYTESLLAQQQQQVAISQARQRLQHQQRQNLGRFFGIPQPGGSKGLQGESSQPIYQQQRQMSQVPRTPRSASIGQPQRRGPLVLHPPVNAAHYAQAKVKRCNGVAGYARLEKKERQEREKHSKRRAELKKDPSANYRHYKECLEYFPLTQGERPNDYLLGLLANQSMPAEPTSDMGLAIQYAKRHWESFWGMKDLEYVVGMAKGEVEKKA